ncbi:MAG TPA: phosphate ABC transporter substrate-binding protein PstS [Actinomycetaceae bacterium]|nr:phosphate ABC transporter substrate-binding protein PstS [Actinomycetaceae bacterium]
MKLAVDRRIAGVAAVSALAISLAACGNGGSAEETHGAAGEGTGLSGQVAGAGASSMENAQNAWIAEFTAQNPGVVASYDPVGSGGGREQFISGTTLYGGSDATLDEEEVAAAQERCSAGEVLELPLYLSPIAVIFNIEGTDSINMSPATLAGVFSGQITTWNDPAIAADNEGVELPDLNIIPVNRSDDSGTTENFTDYLSKAAPEAWTFEADGVWPIEGTQSGAQTSGMIDVVSSTQGTIGYADASRSGDLGTVAVRVGDEFVSYSPEAAARVLEVSQLTDDANDFRLTYDLARDTTESGTYPIVLVAYTMACELYESEQDAQNVRAFLTYVTSDEGQQVAADPDVAGIAPLSDTIRELVMNAVDQISVAG